MEHNFSAKPEWLRNYRRTHRKVTKAEALLIWDALFMEGIQHFKDMGKTMIQIKEITGCE